MEKYKYQIKAVTADAVVFSIVNKELNCILIRRGIEPFKGELFQAVFLKEMNLLKVHLKESWKRSLVNHLKT